MSKKIKNLLLGLTCLVSFGVMGAVSYQFFGSDDPVEIELGGPFELVHHTGRVVTDETFHGRYLFMYFGFTNCPATCPGTLLQMTSILNRLEAVDSTEAQKIIPLFVSVDPDRDTPDAIGSYISHFHDRFEGLTGTREQLTELASAYGSYFDYSPTQGDDYTVNHSSYLYLIGPNGKYVMHFSPDETDDQIVKRISEKLDIG